MCSLHERGAGYAGFLRIWQGGIRGKTQQKLPSGSFCGFESLSMCSRSDLLAAAAEGDHQEVKKLGK